MGRLHDNDRLTAVPSRGSGTGAAARALHDLCPVDLRDAWTFAEAEAEVALRGWTTAPRHEEADAYAVYVAALDREEAAARMLARRLAATPGDNANAR